MKDFSLQTLVVIQETFSWAIKVDQLMLFK